MLTTEPMMIMFRLTRIALEDCMHAAMTTISIVTQTGKAQGRASRSNAPGLNRSLGSPQTHTTAEKSTRNAIAVSVNTPHHAARNGAETANSARYSMRNEHLTRYIVAQKSMNWANSSRVYATWRSYETSGPSPAIRSGMAYARRM